MAVHAYVLSKYMSGLSPGDTELDIRQMERGGSYVIDDYVSFIAGDMYCAVNQFLHPDYSEGFILGLFSKNGVYRLAPYSDHEDSVVKSIRVGVDNEKHLYYCDLQGDFTSRQIYEVCFIDDNDVGYLVTEHIIHPAKGCSLIERCYEPYFTDIRSARQYRDMCMQSYVNVRGMPGSGFRLTVVSRDATDCSGWYHMNLQVQSDIELYNLDPEDYRYLPDIRSVCSAIMADAYDDLEPEEQAEANIHIFDVVKPYVPQDYLVFLEDEADRADPCDLEEIADHALTLALVHAPSGDAFQKIHEGLGPYEYRVGSLTDDIYNTNPDSGYIIVTKDGDFGWYPSCYAVNEWPGAAGNPWFGKFQPNENNTLLCLREFHPELVADTLPKRADIKKYDAMYRVETAKKRMLHNEMFFKANQDKDMVCIGTWYPDGPEADNMITKAMFFRDYGSHSFTDDECRNLLSGEEITVENYKTKMGMQTKIRGRLMDVSGMFDTEQRIDFVRTDINANKRRRMNVDLGGFEEPGLPPVVQ